MLWDIARSIFRTFSECIVLDSIISVGYFAAHWIMNSPDTIQECENLYMFSSIERYVFYGIVSSIVPYPFTFVVVIPYIYNGIFGIIYIREFMKRQRRTMWYFLKYMLCKTIIKAMNGLHGGIIPIKNYNIFSLARIIDRTDFSSNVVKRFVYVSFLNYLRAYETTYMYYKAIKLSQYYQTGNMFVKYSVNESLNVMNNFINNKDWGRLVDTDICSAFYTLIDAKIKSKKTMTSLRMYLLLFFTVWNVVYICESFAGQITFGMLVIHACLECTWKTIFRWTVLMSCIYAGEKAYITSVIVIFSDVLVFVFVEFVFFIRNKNDIMTLMTASEVEEYEVIH